MVKKRNPASLVRSLDVCWWLAAEAPYQGSQSWVETQPVAKRSNYLMQPLSLKSQ